MQELGSNMAEITITIKDIDNGMVTVNSTPNMETMGNLFMNKGLTAAHSFAITALNAIRKESKVDSEESTQEKPTVES